MEIKVERKYFRIIQKIDNGVIIGFEVDKFDTVEDANKYAIKDWENICIRGEQKSYCVYVGVAYRTLQFYNEISEPFNWYDFIKLITLDNCFHSDKAEEFLNQKSETE